MSIAPLRASDAIAADRVTNPPDAAGVNQAAIALGTSTYALKIDDLDCTDRIYVAAQFDRVTKFPLLILVHCFRGNALS